MNLDDYTKYLIKDDRHPGISFDADDLFYQSSEPYFLVVIVSIPEMKMSIPIAPKNIIKLTWENRLNGMYLEGDLSFRDITGKLGALEGSIFSHVMIRLVKVKMENTASMTNWTDIDGVKFEHSFLIDKVELVDREQNEVDYNLHLISDTWLAMKRLIYFSNYDKYTGTSQNERTEEDFNIFKILIKLFNLAMTDFAKDYELCIKGKGFDVESFEKAAGECPKLFADYATNLRTTFPDAFDYLMNRAFYEKNHHDNSIRFLVFDTFEKMFRLIKYKDYNSFVETNSQGMPISLQGGPGEAFVTPTKQNFGSLNLISSREFMDSFIKYTWFDYSPSDEKFIGGERLNNEATLTTADFVDYIDPGSTCPDNKIYRMKEGSEQRKIYNEVFNKRISDEVEYMKFDSIWNTTYSLYKDQVYNTMYRDAVVFNTNGRIRHNPGTLVAVVNEDPGIQLGEDMQNAKDQPHGDITDIFFVVKTTHIVKPADPNDEKFTENLTMQKWWSSKSK